MTTPRRCAKEIHAWAEGEQIQYLNPNDLNPVWRDIDNPGWVANIEYRIKPKTTKILYRRYASRICGEPRVFCHSFDQRETHFPDQDSRFIRWLDNTWLSEEVPNE